MAAFSSAALPSKPNPHAMPYGYLAVAFIAGYNVDFFMKKIETIAQELWGIDKEKSHSVSTRRRDKSIEITINEDGTSSIVLLDTLDNLNDNQARLRDRRTRKATAGWGV